MVERDVIDGPRPRLALLARCSELELDESSYERVVGANGRSEPRHALVEVADGRRRDTTRSHESPDVERE